ncbi:MAG TPA: hypothetical protein VG122_08700 [Gemmata sp.]|nr:hypothetical protein [Gemmata sp.]
MRLGSYRKAGYDTVKTPQTPLPSHIDIGNADRRVTPTSPSRYRGGDIRVNINRGDRAV